MQGTVQFQATCPICQREVPFHSKDDLWGPREQLISPECPFNTCITRERALAEVLFSFYGRAEVAELRIHEASPAHRGFSRWFVQHCAGYLASGYFPGKPFGSVVGTLQNEDLERQTFADETFDIVIHLDVMEHLFHPFQALREIYRTLRPGGRCLFTAPTYPDRLQSACVATISPSGEIKVVGEPEYHGNPQSDGGSLVTWRYGYDLPVLISRETQFDVEVRRFQSRRVAALGVMNEVYILSK